MEMEKILIMKNNKLKNKETRLLLLLWVLFSV